MAAPPEIRVEFFGMVRQYAGRPATAVAAHTFEEALVRLESALPSLTPVCLQRGRLSPGYLANLNGDRFLSDPDQVLRPGDVLLVLGADVGG